MHPRYAGESDQATTVHRSSGAIEDNLCGGRAARDRRDAGFAASQAAITVRWLLANAFWTS